MKRFFIALVLIPCFFSLQAQVLDYARYLDSTLASPEFAGRGYVDKGEHKAALFIADEMKKMNLKSFSKNYLQPFSFSINTITQLSELQIDGKSYQAGIDFMVAANSPSLKGTYPMIYLPDSIFDNKEAVRAFFQNPKLEEMFLLTDGRFKELKYVSNLKVKGIVYRNKQKKLYWHVSKARQQQNFVTIDVLDSLIGPESKTISLDIKAKFLKKYKANNVIGYVEGKKYPDSFVVFTAHFDHLGKMGEEIIFPGASDNASGTSMVLSLAKYFSQATNQPDYSVVFMLVSGEEVGLLGSFYNADHPVFPLKQAKCLINLDMVGTGSKGISVVNAKVYPQIYQRLYQINEKEKYISRVKERGESCNSDHCPFAQKGVPSVFIYSMGDENREYHTVTDTYDRLPFTEFEDIHHLLVDFVSLP